MRSPSHLIAELEKIALSSAGRKKQRARKSEPKTKEGQEGTESTPDTPDIMSELAADLLMREEPTPVENPKPVSGLQKPRERVVAVFIIPEFNCDPPEYGMVLENKSTKHYQPTHYFPSGKVKDTDETPEQAASREIQEEIGITITITPEDLIGKIPVRDHESGYPAFIYIYAKKVPADTLIRPGDEQIAAERFVSDGINELISYELMPPHHKAAWKMYNEYRERRK